jgi:hypothetical protein
LPRQLLLGQSGSGSGAGKNHAADQSASRLAGAGVRCWLPGRWLRAGVPGRVSRGTAGSLGSDSLAGQRSRATEVAHFARAFHSSCDTIEWTAGGLLVEGNDLEAVIAEDSLFHGFDEVVVFDRRPVTITAPPAVFTTDASLSEASVGGLCAYLEAHAAAGAAGDGVGLRWFLRSDMRL